MCRAGIWLSYVPAGIIVALQLEELRIFGSLSSHTTRLPISIVPPISATDARLWLHPIVLILFQELVRLGTHCVSRGGRMDSRSLPVSLAEVPKFRHKGSPIQTKSRTNLRVRPGEIVIDNASTLRY